MVILKHKAKDDKVRRELRQGILWCENFAITTDSKHCLMTKNTKPIVTCRDI